VIVGERYKEVTDQVIRYALGHFGEEAVTAMDQEVRARILDRPRAKEIKAQTREHPTIADMRRDLDAATVSEEELLLRWLLTKEDIAAMRAAGPAKPYVTTRHPLVKLMAELTRSSDCNLIHVSKPGLSLKLERAGAGDSSSGRRATYGPGRRGKRSRSVRRRRAIGIAHGFSDPRALVGRQIRKIDSHRSLPALKRPPVVVEAFIVHADGDGLGYDVLNAGFAEEARKSAGNGDRLANRLSRARRAFGSIATAVSHIMR